MKERRKLTAGQKQGLAFMVAHGDVARTVSPSISAWWHPLTLERYWLDHSVHVAHFPHGQTFHTFARWGFIKPIGTASNIRTRMADTTVYTLTEAGYAAHANGERYA